MANSNGKKDYTVVKSSIVLVLLVALVIGYYYYLSNKSKAEQEKLPTVSAVDEVLRRDLTYNYPATPKEVIKYYSEITKCFYNEDYTDSQMEQLADKAKELYDSELVENNGWGQYIINLKSDVEQFKDQSITISNYVPASSTDVDTFTEDGYDFARIACSYTLVSGTARQGIDEVFLLRKDEDGHWKIFGWDLASNVNIESAE